MDLVGNSSCNLVMFLIKGHLYCSYKVLKLYEVRKPIISPVMELQVSVVLSPLFED
jgi:hypothetical protein